MKRLLSFSLHKTHFLSFLVAFNIFDLNRDHFIQPEELRALLRSVAKVNYASDAELEAFVDQFVANTFERYDANKGIPSYYYYNTMTDWCCVYLKEY